MPKTFTFAGTCVVDSVTVYKFANDANRAAVLAKLGATDVNIIALPQAMSKEAAIDYLGVLGITASKMPRVAKTATKAKAPKVAKIVTPVAKNTTKRVGDKCPVRMDPEEFVARWFAQKADKLGNRFESKKAA